MEKEDRIKYLVDILNKYAFHYYTLDDPLIEDSEYDVLYDELVNLEKETGVVLPNSPTNRIGGEVLSGFEKHVHLNTLYSLGKAQSKEEVRNWVNKTIEFVENYNKNHVNKLPQVEFYVEFKFDGLTVNLTYDGGYLVMATTRGNGTIGEVITSQVRTINSIPLKIKDTRLMEIQGEGVMPLSSLEKYNQTHEPKLKNARNAAAGALRNLDPAVTRERNLDAYFYNVNYLEENGLETQEQMMKFLGDNYFKLYPYEKHATSFEEISEFIEEIFELRNEIDVLTDGVVIKVNDFKTREKLGYTHILQTFFYKRDLIGSVINCKVSFEANSFYLYSQNSRTNCMECSYPHAVYVFLKDIFDPFFHFFGSFVCKGNCQNLVF